MFSKSCAARARLARDAGRGLCRSRIGLTTADCEPQESSGDRLDALDEAAPSPPDVNRRPGVIGLLQESPRGGRVSVFRRRTREHRTVAEAGRCPRCDSSSHVRCRCRWRLAFGASARHHPWDVGFSLGGFFFGFFGDLAFAGRLAGEAFGTARRDGVVAHRTISSRRSVARDRPAATRCDAGGRSRAVVDQLRE